MTDIYDTDDNLDLSHRISTQMNYVANIILDFVDFLVISRLIGL